MSHLCQVSRKTVGIVQVTPLTLLLEYHYVGYGFGSSDILGDFRPFLG